ncbi:hypothetical protein B0O99DRAFT_711327 [Bisporella sp. PMI_857]|nr:hypothetical protein B0O99DRAFT_711327 [Bisporella sp. PMI_857]
MYFQPLLFFATLVSTAVSLPVDPSSLTNRGVIPGVHWTIKHLERYCDAWIYGCAYSFYISRNNGSPDFKCQLVDKQTSPAPPAEQSFWAVPCNQGINPSEGWEISWGYNPGSDGAVMTAHNRNIGQIAWFGWDGLRGKTRFPDVGPHDVFTA